MLLLIPLIALTMLAAVFMSPVITPSTIDIASSAPRHEWHYTKAGVVHFSASGASRFFPYDQMPAFDRRKMQPHPGSFHLSQRAHA